VFLLREDRTSTGRVLTDTAIVPGGARRPGLSLFAASLALAGLPALASSGLPYRLDTEAALIHFLRNECGACHGYRLTGGLGPPLTPDALKGKPPENMISVILHGRPGTPMPGWDRFLQEGDAERILRLLQQGLGNEP
jgi:cytochrome c55X